MKRVVKEDYIGMDKSKYGIHSSSLPFLTGSIRVTSLHYIAYFISLFTITSVPCTRRTDNQQHWYDNYRFKLLYIS